MTSKTNTNRSRSLAVAKSNGPNLTTLHFALKAVDHLIDHGGFIQCTKKEFALRMGWTVPKGAVDEPDPGRVERVCTLTREQDDWPEIRAALGGFVIAYSPSKGGMALVDPTGDEVALGLEHLLSILLGDLQKQQMIKSINRRRLPTWNAAGQSAASAGDHDLARVLWQAEDQIQRTGFVADATIADCFKVAHSRQLIGQP